MTHTQKSQTWSNINIVDQKKRRKKEQHQYYSINSPFWIRPIYNKVTSPTRMCY